MRFFRGTISLVLLVAASREVRGDGGPPEHAQARAFVDYGLMWRRFAARPRTTSARTTTPPAPGAGSTDALVVVERLGVGLPFGAYVGLEAEIGNFDVDPDPATSREIVLGALGVIGVGGTVAPVSLRVELDAGGLAMASPRSLDLEPATAFEARARADLWLTPWITIGATVGASLIDRGDWLIGATLGFHSRTAAARADRRPATATR